MERTLIEIGINKGEVDLSVNCSLSELPLEKLKEVREMIVVATYVAEDMWRRNNQS